LPVRRGWLVPAILFALLAVFSVTLWRGQVRHRRELLESYTQTVADQVAIRLAAWFEARMSGLAVLTGDMARRAGDSAAAADFDFLAAAFYRAQPGFQAINWIGPDGVFRRVIPEDLNPRVRDFDVHRHPEPDVPAAFARAEAETTVAVTRCITLLQGGQGFGSYWPVVAAGRVHGYVNGVFRVEESVRAALAAGVFGDFHLAIQEDGRDIFAGHPPLPPDGAWGVERWVTIPHGHPWRVVLWPRPAIAARYAATGSHLFLLFNLAVSALLSWLAWALIRRTEAARRARDAAVRELAERRRLELEKELTIAKLAQANRDLEQANRELDAYIYAASHDVRAPLVAVAGLVDILLDPDSAPDPDERQHIIGRVRHNIHKLDSLVQDMLTVSRSRRLERTSEVIDIAAVCEEAWAGLKDLVTDMPVEFRLDVTPGRSLRSDPLRFRQIVNNLLSNAVKYRDPAKGRLRVEVTAQLSGAAQGRTDLDLRVRDNGVGVPESCVPRIFDMFYKASGDSFGSGLGLYIVRQHAVALGGEVACVRLDGGTEFRVVLPGDPPR